MTPPVFDAARGGSLHPRPIALPDAARRMQGLMLEWVGFGPSETPHEILHAAPHWRLRKYAGGSGPPLLIIAAPIKRPYIWDLSPQASTIRRCIQPHFRPYLVEWTAPDESEDGCGLDDYAGRFVREAVTRVSDDSNGVPPFLIGHSLGGILATIYAASADPNIRGLVLLATPLCFAPGSSSFRDGLARLDLPPIPEGVVIPGTLLSEISAIASPETFIWSRLLDATFCLSDPLASDTYARVERWTLDEVPLSGRLLREILHGLVRENRFCHDALRIGGRAVGPSHLEVPALAVVNTADAIAPRASIAPFFDAVPAGHVNILEHGGESGVGFQHLAILVGRAAHARTWPHIIAWLRVHE